MHPPVLSYLMLALLLTAAAAGLALSAHPAAVSVVLAAAAFRLALPHFRARASL